MKKLVIITVTLCVMLLLGCVMAETARSANTTYEAPYCLHYQPHIFDSIEALQEAIQADHTAEDVCGYSLKDLQDYFVPNNIPEGMVLSQICVRDYHVTYYYEGGDEQFAIEWYRGREADEALQMVHVYPNQYTVHQSYYILGSLSWYGVTVQKVYDGKHVFWEQDGQGFHAMVPANYTKEDIATYCVVKKITME